ncbi:SMI1/KNR4 family protein [Hahella sp. CR1]|uniref:SMI1/KNR4 family protein n=1 Tax=Hahella sp. CR1 TaxID=2992807 RepID=UPI0024432514|nr:SMI1/KNR4 family protein [Hahella sp. CR1]MDG9668164.1 SMI1/KNR4 family protein [Hahella sp. CR1]
MNFEDFKKCVCEAKSAHPFWFDFEPDDAPDQDSLIRAEQMLEARLPQEYKDFLLQYGGGYFAFGNVFSLEEGSEWNLIDINAEFAHLRAGRVLISENSNGDFFGFDVRDGVCQSELCFWDHAHECWQSSGYTNLFEYLSKVALTN